MPRTPRPSWWDWDLIFSAHARERMAERDCSEMDVRILLEDARRVSRDIEPGRWAVGGFLYGRIREVIVEPEAATRCLIVVTAYPLD